MKKIVLLAMNNGIASTIIGPLEVFAYTGRMWNYFAGAPLATQFQVQIATVDGLAVKSQTGLAIHPDCGIDAVNKADAILVTSCGEDVEGAIRKNAAAIPWLIDHYRKGAILGSICSGLSILAATGLLDGKKATTHWGMTELFRKRFPAINLQSDQILVDEGRLLTAGGGYAGNDLAVYLVEKMCGKVLARQCADALLLETGRQLQTPFSGLLQHRIHADERVQRIQEWLDRNYQSDVDLATLASEHNMSPRNFIRRFKQASGETPLNYLQKLRVEAAKGLLEKTALNINSVAEQVGYQTETHFRRLFTRYTSLTPTVYRSKHSNSSVFGTVNALKRVDGAGPGNRGQRNNRIP
jgi:transcriptional regulator GlxA family with amidase domain